MSTCGEKLMNLRLLKIYALPVVLSLASLVYFFIAPDSDYIVMTSAFMFICWFICVIRREKQLEKQKQKENQL